MITTVVVELLEGGADDMGAINKDNEIVEEL